MKVVLVTPNFHQQRGNTVTVQRIADKLADLNISSEIVSITEDHHIKTLPQGDIIHGFNAYRFYKFKENLETKIDKYFVSITGTDLNHDLFDKNKRADVIQAVFEAEAVHVFSNDAKHLLIREVPEVADKVVVIPQDTDDFSADLDPPYTKEKGSLLFVLPAGIRYVKNIPFAIENLKTIKEQFPFIRLLLVGPILEEKEWQHVKCLIDENQSWINYIGEVPHQQMGVIYKEADVLLNTSFSEGQSTAILEGMAAALPVLVSNNPGNLSLVDNGRTGLVYNDQNDFFLLTKKLILDENFRMKLGVAAKEYVRKHHTNSKEAESFLEMYKQIFQQKEMDWRD